MQVGLVSCPHLQREFTIVHAVNKLAIFFILIILCHCCHCFLVGSFFVWRLWKKRSGSCDKKRIFYKLEREREFVDDSLLVGVRDRELV